MLLLEKSIHSASSVQGGGFLGWEILANQRGDDARFPSLKSCYKHHCDDIIWLHCCNAQVNV